MLTVLAISSYVAGNWREIGPSLTDTKVIIIVHKPIYKARS